MLKLNEIVNQFEECIKDASDKKNCSLEIFKKVISKDELLEDAFYTARAFCSVVNSIVNKKVDYIMYISKEQINLLNFLQTYDDKYLSSLTNTLVNNSYCEIDFVNELLIDIFEILTFLEDTLKEISLLRKEKNFKSLQEQLNEMLEEFEKKYEGDDENGNNE